MDEKGDINQDDMDPNSKEVIKNDSKRIDRDAQTDPGEKEEKNEEQKIEVKIFDYLSPLDEEPIPFNPSIGGNIIYDTKYLEQKMGMRIVILDSNGTQLSSESLVGLKFK